MGAERFYGAKMEPDALGPGSSLLHWFACFLGCIFMMISHVAMNISLNHFFIRASTTFSADPASKWVPYSVGNPLAFFITVQLVMGVAALLLHMIAVLIWRAVGLPKPAAVRRRLREGRSTLGRSAGYLVEQYDDTMIDGMMGRPRPLHGLVVLGAIALLTVSNRYLWMRCLRMTDIPFTQVMNYMFVICIPMLAFWILREPLHGLKILSAFLCFIGIYFHFYASSPGAPSPATTSERLLGITQGVVGAISLGLYLVVYRYVNPAGSMPLVLAYEGLGSGFFAGLILLLLSFFPDQGFHFPTDSRDLLLILYTGLWSVCITGAINEALRWGQPTGAAAAIVVAPTLTVVVKLLFTTAGGGDSSAPIHRHVFALCFTSSGFVVDMLYQFVVATRRRRERYSLLAAAEKPEDVDAEERLLMNGEYTL